MFFSFGGKLKLYGPVMAGPFFIGRLVCESTKTGVGKAPALPQSQGSCSTMSVAIVRPGGDRRRQVSEGVAGASGQRPDFKALVAPVLALLRHMPYTMHHAAEGLIWCLMIRLCRHI